RAASWTSSRSVRAVVCAGAAATNAKACSVIRRSAAGADLGVFLVVAGPSGAGKGTIVRRLLERDPHLWLSTSVTTRAPRPGERDGVDYRFVDRDEFLALR